MPSPTPDHKQDALRMDLLRKPEKRLKSVNSPEVCISTDWMASILAEIVVWRSSGLVV